MHLVVDKSVVPHVGESVVLNIELTASESHEGYWLYFFRKSFKPKFEFKYILCYLKINLLRQYFWTIKWNLIFFLHIFHYILNIITGELEYFFLVSFANSLLFYLFFLDFPPSNIVCEHNTQKTQNQQGKAVAKSDTGKQIFRIWLLWNANSSNGW